ncbi:hypothetical protein Tco_0729309 [Tanacetum coccineum]|uniref:Uncharacterized protein n=1 Tax=Tanacetum coccineum TaxID=301880 RepID=A0ABQ4YRN2_9ASTR
MAILSEDDSDGKEVEKEVNYSNIKEIEFDGQHVKKDVKDEIEIARAALIQQEVGSDNVVRGFKDVKSLSSKRISVCNIVSDNNDMVVDVNNSKVVKVCVDVRMVSHLKKSIKRATKGKYAKSKNVIVGENKMSAQKPSVPTKKGKHEGKGQIADTGKAIADCHKVVSYILADGKSDDVESRDVKKGKSLLSKRRRVYNVVSDDDDDTVADNNKVYVADHVVNDKKNSIKHATKGKSIASCVKVFSDVVVDADNYVKPVYSIVKSDKVESGDVSCDAKKSKSLSSRGIRVFKVVSGDADLIADDNKVIKPNDGISRFDNVVVGNECKSSSTELKSVDEIYKCDKEYEDVPKKRTPSLRQRKIVNIFRCYSSIQENVEALQQIPQQQPSVEEEQLGIQIIPIEDHVDASTTLERLSIFKASQLRTSSLEVPISSHMIRVCQSKPDPAVVSGDVAGILLCDNVSDGSPSIDNNLNEIVQKVKTKLITNTAVTIGSGENLKDDCPVISNQVCNVQNNGSDLNLKDGCPVNSNEVCNYQNNGGDENLKDGCQVNSNEVCNYQNNGGDQNLKDGCLVNSNEVCNYQNNGGDQNLKDGCHVNSNEVCNYHNDGGSFHEVQTESNLFSIS